MKKKFFIDCEFHEYAKQPKLFGVIPVGKPIPTTELISIALVSEDGTEHFYAETDWYDKKAAEKHEFLAVEVLPNLLGGAAVMSKEEIRRKILAFIGNGEHEVELIGWWSAYDWWVFCMELFGTMSEAMPKTGFWYYTDLKELLNSTVGWGKRDVLKYAPMLGTAHNALSDAIWLRDAYFKTQTAIQEQLTMHLATQAHNSICSLIPHVFTRCIENEDGSYTIPKEKVENWKARASVPLEQLNVKQLRTPMNEADKYMDILGKHYFQFLHK